MAPDTGASRDVDQAAARVARLIAGATAVAAAVAVAATPSAIATVRDHPAATATFVVLSIVFQLLSVEVYGKGTIGISAIAILAAGFSLGPGVAILVAILTALSHCVRRRAFGPRAAFDLANLSIAAGAAAVAYLPFGRTGMLLAELAGATVAGAVYSALNNGVLCLAMATDEAARPRDVWRERFHWARYHFVGYGPLALALTVANDRLGLLGVVAFALPPVLTALSVREYLQHTRRAVEEVRAANAEMRRAHRDTIAALTRSISAKDDYTGGHTERVAEFAVEIARRLGYRGEDLEALEIGALLHDVGKIGIPEHILSKPGPLDDDEWEKVKEHPVISDYILAGTALHPFVRQIARWSHERFDGAGYPDGLDGEAIPLPARIVFVADSFDALTSDRPYRPRKTVSAALAEIERCSGTQFCPRVVGALRETLRARVPEPAPAVRLVPAA